VVLELGLIRYCGATLLEELASLLVFERRGSSLWTERASAALAVRRERR
jgi:hypothetical protein